MLEATASPEEAWSNSEPPSSQPGPVTVAEPSGIVERVVEDQAPLVKSAEDSGRGSAE